MKLKNVKKYYKKKIISGWREYLDLKIPYKLLGLEDKFLKVSDIERLLDLKFGDESDFVDHYDMLDYDNMFNDQPLNVNLRFVWEFHIDIILEEYPNLLYIQRGNKYYYLEGCSGYKNPKCIYDKDKGFPKDEPYWLYENDSEHCFSTFYYAKGNDSKEIQELLERFANSNQLSDDLFSGNLVFGLVSGNFGQNISNNLINDLAQLSQYCKTNYEKFTEDSLILTYAIRYKSNIDPFLRDLKKIIKKYKIKSF